MPLRNPINCLKAPAERDIRAFRECLCKFMLHFTSKHKTGKRLGYLLRIFHLAKYSRPTYRSCQEKKQKALFFVFIMFEIIDMLKSSVCICSEYLAHGRVVTSSRQITEVKQHQAWLVLGWVTGARVTLPAMCRGVGQAFHIMLPVSTQQ